MEEATKAGVEEEVTRDVGGKIDTQIMKVDEVMTGMAVEVATDTEEAVVATGTEVAVEAMTDEVDMIAAETTVGRS